MKWKLIKGKEMSFFNRRRAKQLIDFCGLKYQNKEATDVDYTMEINGKFFLFAEVKRAGTKTPRGQEIYFENICNALDKVANAVAVIVEHNVTDPHTDIVLQDCKPVSIFEGGVWVKLEKGYTFGSLVRELLQDYDLGHLLKG